MTEPLEPLDSDLQQLFDVEARIAPESEAAKARVWRTVRASVGPPTGAGGGGGGVPARSASWAGSVFRTATIFLAGGMTGALVYHGMVGTEDREHANDALGAGQLGRMQKNAPTWPAAPAVDAPSLSPRDVPAEPPPTPTANETVPPSTQVGSESRLAEERAIIDVVRGAIARGHTDAAMEAIRRHQQKFPSGQLAEDREALHVIALARAGNLEEARTRADAFRRRYPNSLLNRAINAALPE